MKRIAQFIIPALFPIVLLLSWLCILLSPVFIHLEYRRPGFPPDPYGFTTDERIYWADVSRVYLVSGEDPAYFAQFTLSNGSPLYNERETSHMADVQNLAGKALLLLAVCGPVFLVACAFLFRKDRDLLRHALAGGVRVTFLLTVAVIVTILLAWDWIFVTFHHIFFTGETWLFPMDNTLIRLFPVEFWQDAVVTAVSGILLTSLLVWLTVWLPDWLRHRRNTGHA